MAKIAKEAGGNNGVASIFAGDYSESTEVILFLLQLEGIYSVQLSAILL